MDVDNVPAEHGERIEAIRKDRSQSRQRFHGRLTGHHINTCQLAVMALNDETIYLHLFHFRCNTSHEIFQIVEQETAQRIGEAANDAPFEVVEMLHSHILFPLEPVPPATETAKQIGVKLKVHIQKIVPRIAPRRALSLYTHGGHRHAELRLTFTIGDCYLEVSADGIRESHHFQLVKNGLKAVLKVLQPISVTVHGDHLSSSAGGYR